MLVKSLLEDYFKRGAVGEIQLPFSVCIHSVLFNRLVLDKAIFQILCNIIFLTLTVAVRVIFYTWGAAAKNNRKEKFIMKKEEIGTEEIYLMPETETAEAVKPVAVKPLVETANESISVMPEAKPEKNARVGEILALRGSNRKVYRMQDGSEQAVFYPEAVHVFNKTTETFDDVDSTLIQEEDGRHFVCGKNRFVARFSREEENDELFSIESGMHRVTVFARKNRKQRNHGVTPRIRKKVEGAEKDSLVYEGIKEGADYEYAVTGNGVKENIIVKEKADIYRYAFTLRQENVTAEFDEKKNRIAFISNEDGEEVFFIPAPFMTDANGVTSTAVTYELRSAANGDGILTVTADSNWLNHKYRAFPVVIDPQIQLSTSDGMTTYSWDNGYLYSSSVHKIGTVGIGMASYGVNARTASYACDGSDFNTMDSAIVLPFNEWIGGDIVCPDEEVWYSFVANAPDAHSNGGAGCYTVCTQGDLDTMGYLYDANGSLIANNDDSCDLNFSITEDLTYGETYYLRVRAYSSNTGSYSIALTYTEVSSGGNSGTGNTVSYSPNRMYMRLPMPDLPRNPRIKKAELKFFQENGVSDSNQYPKLGLYQVEDDLETGSNTPYNDSNLIDFAKMQSGGCEEDKEVSYTFDITTLVDKAIKDEDTYFNLVLKMIDESYESNEYISLYGSAYGGNYAPQLIVTYESTYGVNTSYRTHTHELGRFGQGSIDLQCGNLMFESEDFAWAGNRMPVTIKHFYNSALRGYAYTGNSAIKLTTADFSAMKIGYGFKLNVMQSMMPTTDWYEGKEKSRYVYIDENGEETYFKATEETRCDYETGQCDHIYEDVNSGELKYNPVTRTLKKGEETYLFDASGRLIQIKDAHGDSVDITYTANRITSVTDGVGREFGFVYNSDGYLTDIIAPDDTQIHYAYSNNLLTAITYPDGRVAKITYSSGRPQTVTLLDANGNNLYKVAYSYYVSSRLYRVCEYGVENGSFVMGAKSTYTYLIASGRTIVQTTEQMDLDEGECSDNVIKTVYTFDDEGNVISEYVYTEDTDNTGVEGEGSGIHPYSGDGGVGIVSNSNNLLVNHGFANMEGWNKMAGNSSGFYSNNYIYEAYAKFGKYVLRMQSSTANSVDNGMYQVTNTLPMGKYTFSAYVCVETDFTGGENPGAFVRVIAMDGRVLAESEHITKKDSEHIRLIAPFELDSAQSVQVQILINGKGALYAASAQLENNPYANAYNMLENGNFECTGGWELGSGVSYSSGLHFNMSRALMITGNLEEARNANQYVAVKRNRSTRETFTLSGWARGCGLPDHERDGIATPTFRLRAVVKYNDTFYQDYDTETFTAEFSPCTAEWQFASVQFSKSKYRSVESIRVFCDYDNNYDRARFDAIQLVRDSIETDLTPADFPEDSPVEEEQSTETSETPADFTEAKDAYGNVLTETTFADGEFGTIYRAFGFTPECNYEEYAGNDLTSETDARGNATLYDVDEDTSRNKEVTDRCGNKTAYEYDASGRTTKVISKAADDTELANVSYTYDAFDNMTEIVRGDGMKYALAYNQFHNLESIGVEGKDEKLVHYTYKTGNGRLRDITYANGDRMHASYNSAGQMVAEKWYNSSNELTAHYKYVYDGQGNIVRSIDILGEKEYNYTYEEGRIARATESAIVLDGELVAAKILVNTVRYSYDSEGKLTRKVISPAEGSVQTVYYENTEDDNTVVKFTAGGRTVTSRSKTDSFGRKAFDELQLGTSFVSRQFTYHAGEVTETHKAEEKVKSSPTTQLVRQIAFSDDRTISYEYDEEERITKVIDSIDGTTEYTYDALGQLLTETVNGEVVNTMTYDNYGNILTKNDAEYTYGDENWKDLLTGFGGVPITYDAQGNPTGYLGHTLTWEKGRQLKSFDDNTYTYNANGIRTSKNVESGEHIYTLDGTKILQERWNYDEETKTYMDILVPLYDNEESVCGVIYNDVPYYFHKNLQGDVIAIVDKNGDTVARYTYDAWGACTIQSDSTGCCIASINPFRYRGYYYDIEIDMYYLQSRYYDPNTDRFINVDMPEYALLSTNATGHNLVAYCLNNPINLTDLNGNLALADDIAVWAIIGLCAVLMSLISWMSTAEFRRSWTSFCIAVGNGLSWIGTGIVNSGRAAWNWTARQVKTATAAIKAYTVIARADVKIKSKVKKKSKTRYWTATLRTNYVDIGRAISYGTAVSEVSKGRNVFTVTRSEAKAVAKAAYSNKSPVGPEIDKGKENVIGYYYHFHVYNRKKKGHVFFLFW